jgi:hypothetical protein
MKTSNDRLARSRILQTSLLLAGAVVVNMAGCAKNHGDSAAAPTSALPPPSQQVPPQLVEAKPDVPRAPKASSGDPGPQSLRESPRVNATPAPTPPASGAPVLPVGLQHAHLTLPPSYYAAALWVSQPHSQAWTNAAILAIRVELPKLETARDIDSFCPQYESASRRHREICWLRLISGLAKFESSFNPVLSFKEPNGGTSVGLLQVSNGECVLVSGPPDLRNPVANIKCGIAIMAKLINEDHEIDGPPWARGASAYWSTLRPAYQFLGMLLGKKSHVMTLTGNYSEF